ncbi:MAG: alpha/beta fold hydrolase, partial [Pyrinomonadaceae bacterium]
MKQITQKCHRHEISAKHKACMLRSIVSWRELALTLKPVRGKSMNTKLQQHHNRHLPISETATMNQEMKPFVRSEGVGATVICLHASAGSSRQWQPLIKRLRSHYRVMAVDLYGHGLTPDWKREPSLSVDDEAALIEPLVEGVPEGVYLVGQGYGAVVALKLALAHRNRIRGLVLYEPTPFALLYADKSSQPAALE